MEREVTIGVDFGTSTSKVGFRAFGERTVHLMPSPDGGQLLWPSVVGVDEERRLWFADGLPKGVAPQRWLKMQLGDNPGPAAPDQVVIRERFGAEPEELVVLYLAYVVRSAKQEAERTWVRDRLHFTYNLGAPLDQASDPKICNRFERVIHAASRIAPDAQQGWESEAALAACRRYLAQPLPDDVHRTSFVVPETHAAVTGTLLDRSLPDGHYAAIDIGAGTTDIAVFFHRQVGDSDESIYGKAAYFVDATEPVASHHVDYALTQRLWARTKGFDRPAGCSREGLLEQVRQAKEQRRDFDIRIPGWAVLDRATLEQPVRRICRNVGKHFFKTWFKAYQKEMRPSAWPRLNVLLLGGGSLFRPFAKQLKRHPVQAGGGSAPICPEMDVISLEVDHGDEIIAAGTGDRVPVRNSRLLTTVCGLTHHPGVIPEHYAPGQVQARKPDAPPDARTRYAGTPYDHS